MQLALLDWLIIVLFFAISLSIGIAVSRKAGKNSEEFFLSGRSMPWWLLGFSMVATTFSTDTPNLVTDIVRSDGVAGNWVWWAFLLTGMLTVFIYAQLWRRSGVFTDIEFYELRYSGRPAAFLRGFRALYLGVFFNGFIMASVMLAGIKIGQIMFGSPPWLTLGIALSVTVAYSAFGGLRGVLVTDLILFFTALAGSFIAAYYAVSLPQVGGLDGLFSHPEVAPRLNLMPDFTDPGALLTLFILPIAVQWWAVWYPGSEPGGGGYVAQRMLAAKNERHAMGATLLFNAAHYALRPWPWIIVALASIIVFPDLQSIQTAFPAVTEDKLGNDLGYPAMLTFLPAGLLGLVLASLIAAFMSTISTQLNWGSSYITNDFWKRFVKPEASERELVFVGRVTTVVLVLVGALIAVAMQNAKGAFDIMLQIGAGTGLIFILRWFWWRINAWAELTAMIVSFLVALAFAFWAPELAPALKLVFGVGITTFAWLVVALGTPPADEATLREFYRRTRPGGPGWRRVVEDARRDGESLADPDAAWHVPLGIVCMVLGCLAVYGALFATGYWLYGRPLFAVPMTLISAMSAVAVALAWRRLTVE